MRVFVAGASGAIGKRLVPILLEANHEVFATTRSPEKVPWLSQLGARPILLNGLDSAAVMRAVLSCEPEAIVHQMTALSSVRNLRNFDESFALTNRLRSEGTKNLLAAAQAAGTRLVIAQSYAGWPSERRGGRIKTEEDPLDAHPPMAMSKSLAAIRSLEESVVRAPGVAGLVLRYGSLYGPGTSLCAEGEVVDLVRRRKLPIIGTGAGVWSFVHVDDAARATLLALESGERGIYNIVDDDPVEVSIWVPKLAEVIGVKPPWRLPAWLGRLVAGDAALIMMTEARGSSNAKAKRVFGWTLKYFSWREGFRWSLTTPKLAVSV